MSPADIFISNPILSFLAASAALKYAIFYGWHNKRSPKSRLVGHVSGLYIHPVKSCGTLSLQEADCTFDGMYSEGFCDRTWLITLRQGDFYRFITARREPTLELIQPSLRDGFLHLDAPGMDTLILPKVVSAKGAKLCNTDLWGRKTQGVDCGERAARWIRQFLKKPEQEFHLIYFAPEIPKGEVIKDLWDNGVVRLAGNGTTDRISYQDVAPFSLGSQTSLDDLNSRLDKPVSIRNFRMNIAVDGCSEAFDEDRWDDVWIGEGKFTKFFLCDRCTQTTIDPDTAVKHPKQEPKATLEKYRKLIPKTGPMFGVTLVANRPATIRIGDPVYATKIDKIHVGSTGMSVSV